MRFSILLTSALGASAALLLISCSGPGASSTSALPSTAQPSLAQSQIRAASAGPVAAAGADLSHSCPEARLYIADTQNSAIDIYPSALSTSPKPCAIITRGIVDPSGISIDKKGTLYVADRQINAIAIFSMNASSPSRTIFTALGDDPGSVYAGADGTLYVPEPFANQIQVFAPGATSATRTISVTSPTSVATDSKNNLYVVSDYFTENGPTGQLTEFAPGATVGTVLGITVAAGGSFGGVVIAKDDSIVLSVSNEYSGTGSVNIYPPGATTPSRSFPTIGGSIALSQYETRIAVTASIVFAPQFAVYDFKTGALLESSTALLFPEGAAFYPPPPQ